MWEEAQHELPKRFDRMVRGGRFLRATADRLRDTALIAVAFRITVVTTEIYNEFEADARLRVPDDPDDWHTIALALATDTSIWTGDRKHFWGCGIPVWNTRVLRAVLADNDTPR